MAHKWQYSGTAEKFDAQRLTNFFCAAQEDHADLAGLAHMSTTASASVESIDAYDSENALAATFLSQAVRKGSVLKANSGRAILTKSFIYPTLNFEQF